MREWTETELRETLTARQFEILSLVAQRWTSKEIGKRLELSFRTVDSYIADITRKLDVPSRADAARVFLEAGHTTVGNTVVAETLDDSSIPEPSIDLPEGNGLEVEEEQKHGPKDSWPSFLNLIFKAVHFPPVGGQRHELNVTQRLAVIGRIILTAILVAALTVTLIMGILHRLNQ